MRKNWIILRQSFINSTAYGSTTFVWMIIAMLEIIVPMIIWLSATPINGTFGGFSRAQLLTYYALMAIVGNFTFWWIHFDVEEDIRSGNLSNYLVKPISYFRFRILRQFADKFFNFLSRSPIVILILIFTGPVLFSSLSPLSLLLAFTASIIGSLVYMLVSLSFGLCAFWITSSRGLINIYFFTVYLLSGELAPLSFYPTWFSQLSSLLPFRYILSFPIELLLNRVTPSQAIGGFLVASLWLVLLYFLTRLLWSRGTFQYQAYGK